MQVSVELADELFYSLQQNAALHGETPAAYIEHMLRDRLVASPAASDERKPERLRLIESYLEDLEKEAPKLGRNGMPWREFIHLGHSR